MYIKREHQFLECCITCYYHINGCENIYCSNQHNYNEDISSAHALLDIVQPTDVCENFIYNEVMAGIKKIIDDHKDILKELNK